jgi:hypothetical protein
MAKFFQAGNGFDAPVNDSNAPSFRLRTFGGEVEIFVIGAMN